MFTSLTLENFKTWRETGEIDLAPVTVLLGTNSSGKSTLLQSLLLLKQTAASPDRSIHLNLGGDELNDYFNFGHFDDVLTKGAAPRQFTISFTFRRGLLRRKSGFFRAVYGKTAAGAAVIQEMTMADAKGKGFGVIRREKGAYSLYVDEEGQENKLCGKGRNYAPERSIALPVEAIQHLSTDGPLAEDISLAIRRELESIAYLGPLRRKPERDYTWNKGRPGDLGIDGSSVINAILASALLHNKEEETGQMLADVSSWLERMGVAERLEVKQLGHSTRYEIVVHRDGVAANLRDVGIGISQVLPVIVLAYFVPSGATILLEEPEIHLHPLAQSVLAELFVEVSNKRGVQFIVETHSEHLFRRLQTLVAKEQLSVKKCRLYFVEREGADAVLKNLELDQYGRVKEWPPNFFGNALGETSEQARLMFERQKREKQQ
jgi:predicted ATPase